MKLIRDEIKKDTDLRNNKIPLTTSKLKWRNCRKLNVFYFINTLFIYF